MHRLYDWQVYVPVKNQRGEGVVNEVVDFDSDDCRGRLEIGSSHYFSCIVCAKGEEDVLYEIKRRVIPEKLFAGPSRLLWFWCHDLRQGAVEDVVRFYAQAVISKLIGGWFEIEYMTTAKMKCGRRQRHVALVTLDPRDLEDLVREGRVRKLPSPTDQKLSSYQRTRLVVLGLSTYIVLKTNRRAA